MIAFRIGACCVAWLITSCACGGSPPSGDAGLLRKVSSDAELEASLKRGLTAIRYTDGMALSVGAAPAPLDVSDFTGASTQDPDADEFDAVRDETVRAAFWHSPSLVNGPF